MTGETGIAKVHLAFWTIAARLAHKTDLPLELFYALLRAAIPADGQTMALASAAAGVDLDGNAGRLLAAILSTSSTARAGAVQIAIDSNLVRASYESRAQHDLEQLATLAGTAALSSNDGFGKSSLGAVFDQVKVIGSTQERFVQLYTAAGGSTQRGFWRELAKNPAFTQADVSVLRFGVALGRLTYGHLPLVAELAARREAAKINGARDLARLTAEDWKALLHEQVNGVPIGVPPAFQLADPEQAIERYAAQLERNFTASYPTPAFSARVMSDPNQPFPASAGAAAYLDANPTLDLRHSNLDAFAKTAPVPEDVKPSLLAAQRLMKVNPNYSVMSALMGDGIHSASQVYAMGRDHFLAQYGSLPALGPTEAARTYAQAEQTYAVALAVAMQVNGGLAASTPAAVRDGPSPDTAQQLAGYPTLQTLFKPDSWCACRDCQSVLGAPAYLADMLEFLKWRSPGQGVAAAGKSVRDVLLERRSDLEQIELSCANTNTALPYIDLVNELLEDAVAPPTSPSPAARQRQTTLTTAELDANPEYVNTDAYTNVLGVAVFPWTLPFDLPLAEARTYLGQLGVDRVGLIRRFQKPDGYPQASAQARTHRNRDAGDERTRGGHHHRRDARRRPQPMGMVGAAAGRNDRRPERSHQDAHRQLDRVALPSPRAASPGRPDLPRPRPDPQHDFRQWLRRDHDPRRPAGQLRRDEDDGQLGVRRGRREPNRRRRRADPSLRAAVATARLGDLRPRRRDHRPSERRATGLPRLNDQLLRQLAVVATLVKRYSVTVREAVAMFVTTPAFASIPTRDVPTLPGDENRSSLYRDLFQNLSVLNPTDPIFELNDTGTEINAIGSSPLLVDHSATLVAGLQIPATDLRFAIANFTDGKLTLANLAAIYRNVALARMLGLTLTELTQAAGDRRSARQRPDRLRADRAI